MANRNAIALSEDDLAAVRRSAAEGIRECVRWDPFLLSPVNPLPSDPVAEQYVLSAMWEGDLAPKWFRASYMSTSLHQHVAAVLITLQRNIGDPADASVVMRSMAGRGWKPTTELSEQLRSIECWPYQPVLAPAKRVFELAVRREALAGIAAATALLHSPDCSIDEVVRMYDVVRSALTAKRPWA